MYQNMAKSGNPTWKINGRAGILNHVMWSEDPIS